METEDNYFLSKRLLKYSLLIKALCAPLPNPCMYFTVPPLDAKSAFTQYETPAHAHINTCPIPLQNRFTKATLPAIRPAILDDITIRLSSAPPFPCCDTNFTEHLNP